MLPECGAQTLLCDADAAVQYDAVRRHAESARRCWSASEGLESLLIARRTLLMPMLKCVLLSALAAAAKRPLACLQMVVACAPSFAAFKRRLEPIFDRNIRLQLLHNLVEASYSDTHNCPLPSTGVPYPAGCPLWFPSSFRSLAGTCENLRQGSGP